MPLLQGIDSIYQPMYYEPARKTNPSASGGTSHPEFFSKTQAKPGNISDQILQKRPPLQENVQANGLQVRSK